VYDLGEDRDGSRFRAVSDLMMTGHFYPPSVIEFFGNWLLDSLKIQKGDRMVQRARLFLSLPFPAFWAMTEIFVAEATEDECTIGYVTTERHFGRGKWQATLTLVQSRLSLHVRATAGPGSFWFWVGLPVARMMMVRARLMAVEAFRRV